MLKCCVDVDSPTYDNSDEIMGGILLKEIVAW